MADKKDAVLEPVVPQVVVSPVAGPPPAPSADVIALAVNNLVQNANHAEKELKRRREGDDKCNKLLTFIMAFFYISLCWILGICAIEYSVTKPCQSCPELITFMEGVAAIFFWLGLMECLFQAYFRSHTVDQAGRFFQFLWILTYSCGVALCLYGCYYVAVQIGNNRIYNTLNNNSQICNTAISGQYYCDNDLQNTCIASTVVGFLYGSVLVYKACGIWHTPRAFRQQMEQ